jgi:putative transposase
MARPLRLEFPGALYHITAHGYPRESIFRAAADRTDFLDGLEHACARFDWRIWAYCLMGDHYQLLVETRRATLSRGMREVNGVYTQAFNRRHGRSGNVLQGRYKAVVVDKSVHLLELSRYVVLDPLRARPSSGVGDWAWSSYRALIGQAPAPTWLAVAETLAMFAGQPAAARRAYARFVAEGIKAGDPLQAVKGQVFLGNAAFVAKAKKMAAIGWREKPQRQRGSISLAGFERESADRNDAIRAAYASGAYSLQAIGDHFGLHLATISRLARAIKGR